jgi:hypothetical protein
VSAQLHTTLDRLGRELFKFNKVHSHSALQIAHRDLWKLARSSAHSSWELDGLKPPLPTTAMRKFIFTLAVSVPPENYA